LASHSPLHDQIFGLIMSTLGVQPVYELPSAPETSAPLVEDRRPDAARLQAGAQIRPRMLAADPKTPVAATSESPRDSRPNSEAGVKCTGWRPGTCPKFAQPMGPKRIARWFAVYDHRTHTCCCQVGGFERAQSGRATDGVAVRSTPSDRCRCALTPRKKPSLLRSERVSLSRLRAQSAKAHDPELCGRLRLQRARAVDALSVLRLLIRSSGPRNPWTTCADALVAFSRPTSRRPNARHALASAFPCPVGPHWAFGRRPPPPQSRKLIAVSPLRSHVSTSRKATAPRAPQARHLGLQDQQSAA
jgi:hypothetical protein